MTDPSAGDVYDLLARADQWVAAVPADWAGASLVRDLQTEVARLQAEQDTARTLLTALIRVADHGGPSNWRDFVDDVDARALAASMTEEP